jgi:hypothetical protein
LEIKIRYNHKKPLTNTKMKKSEINPKPNILMISRKPNELWVIG